MRTRQLLTVVAVTALLVTGGAVAALQAASTGGVADAQTQSTDQSTVEVAASGSIEAEPDQAVVRVQVVVRGDEVSTVRERLAENASTMRDALEAMGGPERAAVEIRSTDYDIDRNYRARERSDEPEYAGRHSFELTVDDPDRAGDVIVTAVENGATRVDGVQYALTEETRSELRNQALSEAMASSRAQAETIAQESNLVVSGVQRVSTTDVNTAPIRREVAYASADGGAGVATSLEGGQVTVTAQVVVTYEVD